MPFKLPPQLDKLEDHYFALDTSEYGSQLIKSLALLASYLNLTADVIEQALEKRPICFNQRPTEKAKILENIFFKYYAGSVQPYLSMTHRDGEQWLRHVDKLTDPTRLKSSNQMQDYKYKMFDLNSPQALWTKYQQAIKRHTRAWQTLLKQCGLMPG